MSEPSERGPDYDWKVEARHYADECDRLRVLLRKVEDSGERKHQQYLACQDELAQAQAGAAVMRGTLEEVENYLNWHADDLSGDDIVGDGRLTKSFKRICDLVQKTHSVTAGAELLSAAREAKIALGNIACGLKMAEFDSKSGLSREYYYATPETEKAAMAFKKLKAALGDA